jgi:type II secretory pathway pseudopilin PulG
MSSRLKNTSGFTIIEVLLATVIMSAMLVLIGQAFRSSAEGNSLIINKAELTDDVRSAGQMISDYARNAIYVYPPGTSLTLNTSLTGGNYSVTNPRTSTNIWTVGTDNIVAFILPPTQGLTNTGAALPLCAALAAPDSSSCLSIVAYYVVNRANVVANAGGSDNPGVDSLNATNGILYEYRINTTWDYLQTKIFKAGVGGRPPTVIGNGPGTLGRTVTNAQLVADNISVGSSATNYKFTLSGKSCFSKAGIYLDGLGVALPTTTSANVTTYNLPTFVPNCPNALVAATQQTGGVLDSIASMAQANLTISAGRKNNLGQSFTTGDMTFPIAPVNLLIPGT